MAVIHIFGEWVVTVPVLTGHVRIDSMLDMLIVYGVTWALAALCYDTIEESFLRMRRSYAAGDSAPR